MAVTGTPHAGHNRSHARRKKRKLTKAAERAAFPVVLAIKSVTAKVTHSTEKSAGTDGLPHIHTCYTFQLKVGRRASQHRRNRKMKWKQKARKVAAKASRGAVPQSAEDAEVMTSMLEDHLCNYQNNRKKHNISLFHLRIEITCKRLKMVAACFQTLSCTVSRSYHHKLHMSQTCN